METSKKAVILNTAPTRKAIGNTSGDSPRVTNPSCYEKGVLRVGHSFLEVWGVTLSDFHHFPIFICGADAPRTGRVRCRNGVGAALTHRARGEFGV